MLVNSAVLVAVLATTATAFRDVHALVARQTETLSAPSPTISIDSDCLDGLLDLSGDAPYPPADVIDVMTSFFMTATGTYDAQCGWQTAMPASVIPEWNSYESEVLKWYTAHQSQISSALKNCPSDYSSSVGPCTSAIKGAAATGTSGSGSGSGSGSKNAAPVQTAFVGMAAAAAAGFVGVVAAL